MVSKRMPLYRLEAETNVEQKPTSANAGALHVARGDVSTAAIRGTGE